MNQPLLENFWANPQERPTWTDSDWEVVLGQARQSRLLGRLAAHFVDSNWTIEGVEGPQLHLESALRLTDRQQHEVRWEVDRILHALRDLTVPVVLLKGAAYLLADLPPARGRLFADIDLLVPHEQIGRVESALFAAGWISDERDPYNQRYYREWMHEVPPLRHIQRNTFIDLHHTITPPTSQFNVDGKRLLVRIQPLSNYRNLYILAPEDMVLHSAVHLFTEGDFAAGMRDLLDLNGLLRVFGLQPSFWESLLSRAEELGLGIPLFYALFHLERLFGTALPVSLKSRLSQMGPYRWERSLMAWTLTLALQPDHPSCKSRWSGLARWLLYVRSHALRMPLHLILPHLIRKALMRHFPEKKA